MHKKYSIKELLQNTAHRPWNVPQKRFSYYQEWNRALFFHWKVDAEALQKYLPNNLELDLFEGSAWISLVAFTMEKIRPRLLPAVSLLSNFDEINLRTYVVKNGKQGVYFLNIEAGKKLSADVARFLSGLPYEFSMMRRNNTNFYQAQFDKKGFRFKARYRVGKPLTEKSDLDVFLTERYCLYTNAKDQLFRYEIQHLPWEIHQLWVSELETQYQIGTINLSRLPDKMHYSQGVQVVAWGKEEIS